MHGDVKDYIVSKAIEAMDLGQCVIKRTMDARCPLTMNDKKEVHPADLKNRAGTERTSQLHHPPLKNTGKKFLLPLETFAGVIFNSIFQNQQKYYPLFQSVLNIEQLPDVPDGAHNVPRPFDL